MIGVRHRFHGRGSLRGVYARGRAARHPLMSLRSLRRDPRRPYRVAVVVSRKVNKSAVVRNRIRRRVYELVRQADDRIEPGTDLVFTVFDDRVARVEAAKLHAAVEELLQKAASSSGRT